MNIDSLKEMTEKANMFNNLTEDIKNYDKHLKGYMFDSLVYRYQLALEQRVEVLARQYVWSGKYNNKTEAEAYVRQHENKRDLMAFIRILDEAIGDHD